MYILGVSCYYHDAAAVLLNDGALVAAAEEERFSRIKHDFGFPKQAIQFCLDQAGITGKDLDYDESAWLDYLTGPQKPFG